MKIKIVGIDPSLNNFGLAKVTLDIESMTFAVDDLALVKTATENGRTVRKNSDDIRRAKLLHDGMIKACDGAFIAMVEVPVGSQSARAMASYGVCCGVLAACPIPMIQLNPTEVKLAGYGNKTATKHEMIEWATNKYPDANWLTQNRKGARCFIDANEHLADALGAIEAGIRTDQFRQLVAMFRAIKVSHA